MQLSTQGLIKPLNLLHGKGKWYWLCVLGCAVVIVLLYGYTPSKLHQGPRSTAGPLDGEKNLTHLAVVATMGSSDSQVRSMLSQDTMLTFHR